MNILHVYPIFNPEIASGAAKVAYEISKRLVNRGHNVAFLTSDMIYWGARYKAGKYTVDNILVYRLKTFAPILAKKFKISITPRLFYVGTCELKEFDVVHLHGYISFQNFVLYYLVKKYGLSYVIHAHGSLSRGGAWPRLKEIYSFLFGRKLLREASKLVAISPIEATQYETIGIPREKIVIIPNGVDLADCAQFPPKGQFRKKYKIGEDKKIILFVGRINRYKGLDFLIKGFAYLTKKMDIDSLLVIVGPDDGYLKDLVRLMREYEVEKRVLLTGPLFGIQKIEAYVDASVFVSLDSLKDVVFLLTPLEAAVCNTPVILTKSNYIAHLADQEKFGYSVNYGNIKELAIKLKEILTNEDLAREMGTKGRDFVRRNFTWDRAVRKLEKVYKEVNN